MRTSGTMSARAAVGVADSAAGVSVAVDAGVGSIGDARAVRAMNTLRTATVMITSSVTHTLTAAVGVDSGV